MANVDNHSSAVNALNSYGGASNLSGNANTGGTTSANDISAGKVSGSTALDTAANTGMDTIAKNQEINYKFMAFTSTIDTTNAVNKKTAELLESMARDVK